jgi:hypothetical protein
MNPQGHSYHADGFFILQEYDRNKKAVFADGLNFSDKYYILSDEGIPLLSPEEDSISEED